MADKKRFKSQKLNSEDYEKTEEGAKLLKHGGALAIGLAAGIGALKKYGPKVAKGVVKIVKK